jgi:hypothetical protein
MQTTPTSEPTSRASAAIPEPIRPRNLASSVLAKLSSALRGEKYMIDAYPPAWGGGGGGKGGGERKGGENTRLTPPPPPPRPAPPPAHDAEPSTVAHAAPTVSGTKRR